MYKFFMNKHSLINESWREIQTDESWDKRIKNEKINESWDEEVCHDSCKMQDDLKRKTETF